MNDITEPLVLSRGSHQAGSGRGCAMNVISWENGDTTITDFPSCSDPFLASLVQGANDALASQVTRLLSPANSLVVLDLGHATVGTSSHGLMEGQLVHFYADIVEWAEGRWGYTFRAEMIAGKAVWILRNEYVTIPDAATYSARAIRDIWHEPSKPERVAEVIEKFKELTGTTSVSPDPTVTACAVEKMLARA